MTIQLTIIGLGQIGASLGLALSGQTNKLTRTGHDFSPLKARQVKEMGAVDKIENNLHAAVEKADVVILAVPVDEIRTTLEKISPALQPGVVVLDTSTIKNAVSDWAVDLLPEDRHFVSFMPTLNPAYLLETSSGSDAAHNDLFKNGLVLVDCPPDTESDAIKLASDLASLLGAKAMFIDRFESDGLSAFTHQAPGLLAAAFINAQLDQPGWTEGRKVAGKTFAVVTEPLMHLEEDTMLGKAAIMNRENVVRVINNVITALIELRDAVAAKDEAALTGLLKRARDGREQWWQQRQSGDWDRAVTKVEMPTGGDVMARFFGFRRKKKEK